MLYSDDLLNKILKDPTRLDHLFSNPLSIKEEFYLMRLKRELAKVLKGMLDKALAGSSHILHLSGEKQQIMDIAKAQDKIMALLKDRGNMQDYKEN